MKLFKRILPMLAIFGLLFSLASCGYSFYNDFKAAGAELENGDSFKVVTGEEVTELRKGKKEFVILIGTSNNTNCVNAITKIQNEFDYLGYKGYVNFVNAQDAIKYQSKGAELTKTLNVKSINPGSSGIIFVEYDANGNVVCDTSKDDQQTTKFKQNGSLSFRAIADYIVEYYSIEN